MIFCNNVTKWLYLPISAFFQKNILTRVEGRDILTKLSRKSAARSLKNGITERGKHLQKISDGTRQFFRVTTTQKSKEQKKALERF